MFKKFCLAVLSLVIGSVAAMADDGVLYTWDFTNSQSACSKVEGGQGKFLFPSDADAGVVLDVDATNGKFWPRGGDVQVNSTTVINVPVKAKGDVITIYNYPGFGTTYTIGAETKNNDNQVYAYTVSAAEASLGHVAITVTGGGYMHKFSVLQHEPAGGRTYVNEPVSVAWNVNAAKNGMDAAASLDGVFCTTALSLGDMVVKGAGSCTDAEAKAIDGVTLLRLGKGASTDVAMWTVKPSAGLTFTPTRISGYVNRYGTDKENCCVISLRNDEGVSETLLTATALRNGKTSAQKPYDATAISRFDITLSAEQQARFATTGNLYLGGKIVVDATKDQGYGNIVIEGTVSGTAADVAKYALLLAASPAEGGTATVYPAIEAYEEGTEVTLTAAPKFGYHFVNWTDESGNEVSAEPKFKYAVNSASALTANFQAVATCELSIGVEGGAAGYMVSCLPEPAIVDGKMMYEAGQKVSLTAASNDILSFSSWSTGETSSTIDVTMDADKVIMATYSAVDFIAAWDFHKACSESRHADFYAEGNDNASIVLRNEAGETFSWLDKSQEKGGYEGHPGAVNWKSDAPIGTYYWQTKGDASAFTNIRLVSSMVYNYNAYPVYDVDYSFDGSEWTNVGSITVDGAKNWTKSELALPAECNNQPSLYIRWKADQGSTVAGTESANDGNCLGEVYILGTMKLVDDGKAPVLLSSVPAEGSSAASTSGRVVLNFDEKVKVSASAKATLNGVQIAPVVSGRSISFEYRSLNYASDYIFRLPAGCVSDLAGNTLPGEIVINFSTRARSAVQKGTFDAVVTDGRQLAEAIAAANSRADKSVRYRILVVPGSHVIPASSTETVTGGDNVAYADPRTVLSASNVSIVGVDYQTTSFTNITPDATWNNGYGPACPLEGIGKGDVLIIRGSNNYFQGITIKTSMGDGHGRDIAFNDQGDKTIFKNARLMGYQDTYVSNNANGRFYFENGVLRGRTDYLCGKGDVFFNEVTLQQVGTGGYLAVPSNPRKYGYVFSGCRIVRETPDVTYYLGRPWGNGTPIALFINTTMETDSYAAGWAEMGTGWPARFAEFGSVLTTGTAVELGSRKKYFGADNHENDPVLTADEAAQYTVAKVMGDGDDWDPTYYTEQAPVPANLTLSGDRLSWDGSDYALCWVVFKGSEFVGVTTTPSFTLPDSDSSAAYYVYAANEMGGLSEPAVAGSVLGIGETVADAPAVTDADAPAFNLGGQRVGASSHGIVVQKGRKVLCK
ncbi:MAG: Ig-like domain-containing protein [Bacteroidaceae bacterium]|nr:Ig-like domain-containing protein [Bacteroidaceae bacterium]